MSWETDMKRLLQWLILYVIIITLVFNFSCSVLNWSPKGKFSDVKCYSPYLLTVVHKRFIARVLIWIRLKPRRFKNLSRFRIMSSPTVHALRSQLAFLLKTMVHQLRTQDLEPLQKKTVEAGRNSLKVYIANYTFVNITTGCQQLTLDWC